MLCKGGEDNAPVRALFESGGVEPTRLRLTPAGPRQDYLRLADEIDISLDPFPYAGMTTTCDFLWQGVPTVTLGGASAAANAGVSLLRAIGLPNVIAATPDDYVRIAATLAADLPALARLRTALRDRFAASPLREERGLARRMERAYRVMWQVWCARNTG